MTDNASPGSVGEAAGASAGGPIPLVPNFKIRRVPPPTAEERQARRDAMERAIKHGAAPYRDAEGKARYVFFKEANNAPVEAWRRDREAKRGFRRTQQARKAAGQLIWHPEDQIELAKRLGVIYHREGRSVEGAAERGLYDAIWRYEHIWDSFTVPRRFGRDTLETGRIAAVAEEEARKLQAEDPKARGGFWVRDRKNNGLIYVVPNPDPGAADSDALIGGEGEAVVLGQASVPSSPPPLPWHKPADPGRLSPPPSGSALSAAPSGASVPLPATADDYFAVLRQNLAPREGGKANRPANEDPGLKTNKGVTQRTLDRLHTFKAREYRTYPTDPDNLTDDQIDTILRKEYYDPLHIWQIAEIPDLLTLAPQLPDQLFDIGVQHGVGYAGRVLQEALLEVMGIDLRIMKNGALDYDGIVGPATRNAIARAIAAGKIVELNNRIVDKRRAELMGKAHKKDNSGWFPRVESFRILPSTAGGNPVVR